MSLPTSEGERELRTSDTEAEMWQLADERGPGEARRTYPSGWLWVTGESAVADLLDVLLAADSDARYGTEDLAARSGLAERATEDAVDSLIGLGVLVADQGAYRINERAIVYRAASELSDAVAATGVTDAESGFAYLADRDAVRLMIDALLEAEPEQALRQEDIHRLTGVSRKRVWIHVEKLVALSLLEESGDEYVLDADSPVLRWVQSLDAAVVGARLTASHP